MKHAPDVLLLAGVGAVLYGAALIYPPAAWIIAGLAVIAAALRLGATQ